MIRCIDKWVKRLGQDYEETTESRGARESAEDEVEDPSNGPHDTKLCEMCQSMKKRCWR